MDIARFRKALPLECDRLLFCAVEGAPFAIGGNNYPPNLLAIALAAAEDSLSAEGCAVWRENASREEWESAAVEVRRALAGEPSTCWAVHPAGAPMFKASPEAASAEVNQVIASQVAFERVIDGIGGPLDAYAEAIRKAGTLAGRPAKRDLAAIARIFEGLELVPGEGEAP